MCSRDELNAIVGQLCGEMSRLFPEEAFEVILFGSYARDEAAEGSDVDLLFLVDASRETIAEKNWQIGEAAAELLMEYGVVVSPIVENRGYFQANAQILPFFRNIAREGVRMSA